MSQLVKLEAPKSMIFGGVVLAVCAATAYTYRKNNTNQSENQESQIFQVPAMIKSNDSSISNCKIYLL